MSKLKSSFVLKQYSDQEKLVELYLNFGYKEYDVLKAKNYYKPLRYYTGIRVKVNEWDKENKVPTNTKKLNQLLSIEQTAIDIYNYLSKSGAVTPDSFRSELDQKLKNKEVSQEIIGIRDYILKVIMVSTSSGRTKSTLRSYDKLAKKIEAFEEQKKITITASNLNESIYLEFIDFNRSSLNRINSVWSIVKVLKSVLREIGRKYKIQVFNPTNELSKVDRVTNVNEEKVYFTFDQIKKVIDYHPKSERLQNTKLILLTLLFTGCRYSDVFKINPEFSYAKDDLTFRYTRLISQKTDQDIIIPILAPLEAAYAQNEGKPPYKIVDTKFNEYVKELVKNAKLIEEVQLSYTDAYGKKRYETKSFHKFVSSHIGRRSFITNLINIIPVTILTKITGHSLTNKSVIFGYNKISLLDNAVLFMRELKRVTESNPKEFPIKLV